MNTLRLWLFMISGLMLSLQVRSEASRIEKQIIYQSEEATEVFMVWGIDHWALPSSEFLPPGSFIKDNLAYTPLKENGKIFETTLSLPARTTLDYVFWITKGVGHTGTDIWDTNAPGKDFHETFSGTAPIVIRSAVKARPSEELSVLDYAIAFFFILLLLTINAILIFKRSKISFSVAQNTIIRLVALAFSVYFFLLLVRPTIIGLGWDIYLHPFDHLGEMISASVYDLLLVGVLLFLFLVLAFASRRHASINRSLPWIFGALGLVCVLAAALNIKVVQMLGRPFNYQWLYYSDFLKSADSRLALSANVSTSYILRLSLLCSAYLLFAHFSFIALTYFWYRLKLKKTAVLLTFCVLTGVYAYANKTIREKNWAYNKLANPVTAFLESVSPFTAQPELFTMVVKDSLNDFLPAQNSPLLPPMNIAGIKNVVFFVMESTPAEYVEVFGGKFPVTPSIKEYSSNAIVFNNAYAHAPATNLSMVSILGSVYPWLSYNSFTQEHPDLDVPTINSELKKAGYRSGFFNSADNRFQKAGEFLRHHRFDSISDCRTNTCNNTAFSTNSDWEFMDGKSDACTAQELSQWIKQDPGIPFFAVMWTYQTHYPYFFEGEEVKYSDDPFFNRYLNALKHTDTVFSELMQTLKDNNLYDSTLVVVVGDHGEAFGRHDQISHGRKIYEENLHVPLLFIHPAFHGTRNETVCGLVDIAPTVMHLIGQQAPGSWQGRSIFSTERNDRVYFFAPWSDFLFGYREANVKFIYNATTNQSEMYDLSTDPLESQNLATDNPGSITFAHQRLAAWTQYVNKETSKMIEKTDKTKGVKILADRN